MCNITAKFPAHLFCAMQLLSFICLTSLFSTFSLLILLVLLLPFQLYFSEGLSFQFILAIGLSCICDYFAYIVIYILVLFSMFLIWAEAYTGIQLPTASRSFPIEMEKLKTLNRDHDSVLLQEIRGVS